MLQLYVQPSLDVVNIFWTSLDLVECPFVFLQVVPDARPRHFRLTHVSKAGTLAPPGKREVMVVTIPCDSSIESKGLHAARQEIIGRTNLHLCLCSSRIDDQGQICIPFIDVGAYFACLWAVLHSDLPHSHESQDAQNVPSGT